jgi:phosphate transport system substrate-binding protein
MVNTQALPPKAVMGTSQVERKDKSRRKMRKISGILAAGALLASIAFVAPAAHASETITGSGSSFMNSFQQVCSALYTKNKANYTSTGSSTGLSQFKAGTTNFGGTDNAYAAGTAPSNFTYVPLVAGAIVIAYNVPGVTNLRLTPQVISDIFTGKVKTWDAAPIKKLNPTAKLPKDKIQVVYRSDGSGTTNNFTNYMKQTVGGKWTQNSTWATGLGQSPVGIGSAQNQGVVSTVSKTKFAITYADPADAKKAKLTFAAIQNGNGEFVKPTAATAGRFIAAQKSSADGLVTFNYKAKVKGAYPITLVAYGLAPTAASNKAKAAAVKDYFSFIIQTCGPRNAAAGDYVAITGKLQATALKLINTIK